MWHMENVTVQSQPRFASSTQELLQTTSRTLVIVLSGIYLLWHLVATVYWPVELGPRVWLVSIGFAPLTALVLYQLPRRQLLAQSLWLAGLALLLALALYLFRQPELVFLYALLPLLAVVMIHWAAGIATELVILLIAWLGFGWLLPPSIIAGVVVAGAVTGIVGWGSTRTLATVAQWSFFSFTDAQRHMEEAQQHRARMAFMLKDLDHAYYRLERANAALVAARKVAEEAERFKAEFVANVSHELRTPLNLIVGFSEVMMTSPESYGVDLPGPYRSDLNAIYRSAQHLLSLVDDVLDLARIETGKISLVREEVDLTALVSESADTMRDYIQTKGLAFHVRIAPNLPRLWLDRVRIRQVLLNLLVNAARFTERGSITIDVALDDPVEQTDSTNVPSMVRIKVRDTGSGISAADLPKVFEEFRTTEQPVSAWHSGTGLGLPISKRFVELHGGQMRVESQLSYGTTFWFTLPAMLPAATPAQSAPARRWNPLVPLGSAERILVVAHDDPLVASLFQRHLESCRVVSAPTLAEGIVRAEELKAIAIITSDAQSAQQARGSVPILYSPLPSSRQAAAAMGAIELLTKPVSRQDLLAVLARVAPVERVLIVDDEPNVVQLFQRMLRSELPKASVQVAYDGNEALQSLRQTRPDVVLLDLHLPQVDGQEVLETMSRDSLLSSIPVIIVSGQGQDYLNLPLAGTVGVRQQDGFRIGEIIRMVDALTAALAPGWRQLDSTELERPTAPSA